MIIVALGHQKFVGKDQFAKFCIDHLRQTDEFSRKKIVRRGFADKLYDFCYSVYGWAGFQTRQYYIEHPEMKQTFLEPIGMTARDMLIKMGNKLRENIDPYIWLNACVKDQACDVLFITDARYPNEFIECEKAGAVMVKITRDGLPEPTDEADTALNGWDDRWHHILKNTKDLNNLRLMAETFCRHNIENRKK